MRRLSSVFAFATLAAALLVPTTTYAQQSVNFYIGGFAPSVDTHSHDENVISNNLDFLAFNVNDFNGVTYAGKYLLGVGKWLDAGLGVGYSSRPCRACTPT